MNDTTQQMVEMIRQTRREEREREEQKKRDLIEFRRKRLEKQQLERMLKKERARRTRRNRLRAHHREVGKPFYEKPAQMAKLVDEPPIELDAAPTKTLCGSCGPVGSAIAGSNLIRDYCCVCGEPMRVAVLRDSAACLSCQPTGHPGTKHDTFEAKQIAYHGSQHASGEW